SLWMLNQLPLAPSLHNRFIDHRICSRPAILEILLRNGRRLKVPADVELKLLGPLVACVEAA
ncbi:hypothetical protein V6R98_27490, partial [Agrobacterium sp. CCNWLW71]|uniref:hypothetical protein n=1 Tax=unclassified Agrobacterium TaxID=2632611 RepID=UPI002FF1A55E